MVEQETDALLPPAAHGTVEDWAGRPDEGPILLLLGRFDTCRNRLNRKAWLTDYSLANLA